MIQSAPKNTVRSRLPARVEVAVLLSLAGLIASYVLLRYGGRWGEGDTQSITRAIRSVIETGRLTPGGEWYIYPNGYGYQAVAAFLINVTGMSLAELQVYGSMLLMVWIVFPAWLAYRELTGTRQSATLATVILLVQPELLFALLRGTHEKFTRGLMLLCLYFLIRSLRSRNQLAQFAAFVLAFYVAAHALITLNNLLATSFIVAVSLALMLSWVVIRMKWLVSESPTDTVRRLALVNITLLVIAYIVIFYTYTPMRHSLLTIQSMADRVVALTLNVETQASNPYAVVGSFWISQPIYFLVSLANWLLLFSSAAVWFWQSWSWLRGRWRPQREHQILLWALYAAFAFQGALSIVVDISGAVAGNLQIRIFPAVVMLAAPVVAQRITDWKPKAKGAKYRFNVGLGVVIGILAVLSMAKVTNEPMVANKWLFYIEAEMKAMNWAEKVLADRAVWSDYDDRMFAAIRVQTGAAPLNVKLDRRTVNNEGIDYMISDVTRARSVRWNLPLPIQRDSLITYDNGQAQMYHRRPPTPYQR